MAVVTSGKDKVLRYARIFVDAYDLSGDARTVGTLMIERTEIDMTAWSNSIKQFLTGYRTAGITDLQVLLNDDTGRGFDVLKDAQNLYTISVLLGGQGEPTIGDPAYLLPSVQLSDATGIDAGAAIMTGINFMPSSSDAGTYYGSPLGVVLHPKTSLTVTTTPDSHDIGIDVGTAGATALGWSANIHVTASDAGTWVFTIEHGTNDSDWATLGTFTAAGDVLESEHISGTGTVNRYVRALLTRTSGTATPVITFARNF